MSWCGATRNAAATRSVSSMCWMRLKRSLFLRPDPAYEPTLRRSPLARGNMAVAIFLACRGLTPAPTLRPLAVSAGRANELDDFGHLEADFVLDDFTQDDVGQAQSPDVDNEGPGAAVQPADALGDQV